MKDCANADGEVVTIVEFVTLEQVRAWKDHPEHRQAQVRGRTEFFANYRIQVYRGIVRLRRMKLTSSE